MLREWPSVALKKGDKKKQRTGGCTHLDMGVSQAHAAQTRLSLSLGSIRDPLISSSIIRAEFHPEALGSLIEASISSRSALGHALAIARELEAALRLLCLLYTSDAADE